MLSDGLVPSSRGPRLIDIMVEFNTNRHSRLAGCVYSSLGRYEVGKDAK